jgi:DNA-binding NarL/FixJ family response regulator
MVQVGHFAIAGTEACGSEQRGVGEGAGAAGHDEVRELLAAYALGAVDVTEAATIEAHLAACGPCRGEVRAYEAIVGRSEDRVDRVWERISTTLAGRREDLDVFLAGVLNAGGTSGSEHAPVRVLVAADTEPARALLVHRLQHDPRFLVVAEATTPERVLGEGVAALPDLVLVKLSSSDRRWLDALGELASWSPRTRLIAVSGLHANHLAEVVLTAPVARDLAAGRPPGAAVAAVTSRDRGLDAAPEETPPVVESRRGAAAPRSLIQEVMRQMGIPVRARAAR